MLISSITDIASLNIIITKILCSMLYKWSACDLRGTKTRIGTRKWKIFQQMSRSFQTETSWRWMCKVACQQKSFHSWGNWLKQSSARGRCSKVPGYYIQHVSKGDFIALWHLSFYNRFLISHSQVPIHPNPCCAVLLTFQTPRDTLWKLL